MNVKVNVWAQKCCWASRIEELAGEAMESGLGEMEVDFDVQFSAKSDHAENCPKSR